MTNTSKEVLWIPSGTLARVPAIDSVKLTSGQASTVAVDANKEPKTEEGRKTISLQNTLGGGEKDWEYIYIPPQFRLRLMLCLYCLWITVTAALSACLTIPRKLGARYH